MKRILCLVLMLNFLLAARTSASELVAMPLSGIEGRYYVDSSIPEVHYGRTVHFELDRIPMAVNRVWIHISGVFSVGAIVCDFTGMPEGHYAQGIEYLAEMKDTINGSWFAAASASPVASGTFEYTNQFSKLLGSVISWDFLKAGYGNLDMNINFGMFPECSVTIWPEATITAAELIIDGDFPVSVQQSTWGSIKSLYR